MAALRYSSDDEPGISRVRRGRGFAHRDHLGAPVTNRRVVARIENMAVPPAWADVWICSSSRGHIQAIGRDARGRKQYIYHPSWRAERDREKHERILDFAARLPSLRRTARRHLRSSGLTRDRALATAVLLLDRTSLRIGSERYARENGTYGLTTMRSKHIEVDGETIVLDFVGKGGKRHQATVRDAPLATAVGAMDELPGREVLSYRDDDGEVVDVTSDDVNAYIKEHAGEQFSAKDFRTWAATVAAAVALDELGDADTSRAPRRSVVSVVRTVARLIGNTPAVCRASYIDPRVIDRFMDGQTLSTLRTRVDATKRRGLSTQELLVLALLRQGLRRTRRSAS